MTPLICGRCGNVFERKLNRSTVVRLSKGIQVCCPACKREVASDNWKPGRDAAVLLKKRRRLIRERSIAIRLACLLCKHSKTGMMRVRVFAIIKSLKLTYKTSKPSCVQIRNVGLVKATASRLGWDSKIIKQRLYLEKNGTSLDCPLKAVTSCDFVCSMVKTDQIKEKPSCSDELRLLQKDENVEQSSTVAR